MLNFYWIHVLLKKTILFVDKEPKHLKIKAYAQETNSTENS
jgi:hypothetical protein